MVSATAQLLWFENTKLGENRGILKPSWAFAETKNKDIYNMTEDISSKTHPCAESQEIQCVCVACSMDQEGKQELAISAG